VDRHSDSDGSPRQVWLNIVLGVLIVAAIVVFLRTRKKKSPDRPGVVHNVRVEIER
jgi:heme/copper-type cytochrome/quinol oxidase subunit 2